MITRRDFLSSCAVTAAAPCADAAAQVTDSFNITVTSGQSPIIPANRTTLWQPGVTYNAIPGVTTTPGIPHRTTIYQTLSPLGGGQDDSAQIMAAINAAPNNTVVQLTAGVFTITKGIYFTRNNITLRGAGPGTGANTGSTFVTDSTATQLYSIPGAAPWTTPIAVGNDPHAGSVGTANELASYSLYQDGVKGTYSAVFNTNTGVSVGEIVIIDINTDNHPLAWWGNQVGPPGGGPRRWFCRQDRSINQMMRVTSVAANTPSAGLYTVTFETPFHNDFLVAYSAMMTRYSVPWTYGVGIEEMQIYGGGNGDWQCAITFLMTAYSWVRHVETWYNEGSGHVGFHGSYRCELRDSYHHESPHEYPGGGGYLTSFNWGASDCLIENCIMWKDDKVTVSRGAGGGNVVAYCYMDDAYGMNFPQSPEAGVNAGHYTCPSFALLEGNYSHNYKGDTFWGNSIYITVFRNWITALRAAHPPLNTYTYNDGAGHIYPYMDLMSRIAVDVQGYSRNHNFVGNVLGKQDQVLLSYTGTGFSWTQVGFQYENYTIVQDGVHVYMWNFGAYQDSNGNWLEETTTYQTMLRQGNWDWVTKSQIWYANPIGATGSTSNGTPQPIPNSLYLTAAPPFFGSNPWPWVDPSTGNTYTLPAKARFDAGTPNTVQ
jgi:hypothetical protein